MPKPPKPLLGHLQPVVSFVTPKVADILFYELHDDNLTHDRTPEYGDPHPHKDGFKLVFMAPNDPSEPHIRKWFYAADRDNQADYNFEQDEQRLMRTYVIPRTEYTDGTWTTPADGTQDTVFTDYYFAGEEQKRIGDQTLDSYFVTLVQTYVNQGKIVSDSEQGAKDGERGSAVTLGHTKSATAVNGSIIIARNSQLTKGDVWRNTENRLQPRTGTHTTKVTQKVGMTETSTTELDTSEPAAGGSDSYFSKALVTQDVAGADALWTADRLARANDASQADEITKFLGGGVATSTYSLVAEATAPTTGFLVIASKVEPLGDGNSLSKHTVIDEYPTLVDYKYDTQLDAILQITKTVVDASTNPTGSYSPGSLTEIKAYDKWRSLSITTSGIGVEKTTYLPGVFQFRFPPVLNSVTWIGAYAFAGSGDKFDYDFDVALIFDVTEAYAAAVDGRIIRVVTKAPESVVGAYPPVSFKPQSHTIGMVNASYYASDAMVWAKASARTWQTPMALSGSLSLAQPGVDPGTITVNAQFTSLIPPTSPSTIPTGWITIGVTTNRLKLGYYEVIVRQINSPGP